MLPHMPPRQQRWKHPLRPHLSALPSALEDIYCGVWQYHHTGRICLSLMECQNTRPEIDRSPRQPTDLARPASCAQDYLQRILYVTADAGVRQPRKPLAQLRIVWVTLPSNLR